MKVQQAILFSLLFFALPGALFAGSYTVNTTNYDDGSGNGTDAWCRDCVTLDSNITADTNGGFSVNAGTSGTITLDNVQIRRGQRWTKLNLTYSGADSITVVIKNSSGDFLNGSTGETVSGNDSATIDMSGINNKTGAADLTFEITLDGTDVTLFSATIKYSSNSLVAFPNPYTPSQGNATIRIDLDERAVVTLSIYDSRNFLVKRIYNSKSFSGFDTPNEGISVGWNGKNSNGNLVPSGVYTVIAKVNSSGGDNETLRFRILVIR